MILIMRLVCLTLLSLFGQLIAQAQLESDTLTVTVISYRNFQLDQVQIGIMAITPAETTLDEVLSILQPSGAGLDSLTFVYSYFYPDRPTETDWLFVIPVPFANLKDKLAALTRIQGASPWDVSFQVQGVQSSPESLASNPCVFTHS